VGAGVAGVKRRAAYFVVLCVSLATLQLRAGVLQLLGGYRPFGHAAKRVDFSWDMFAVPIERCAVTWDPALSIQGKRVVHWRDRGTYFEWDTAMANSESYEQEAVDACDYRTAEVTSVRVSCIRSDGAESESRFPCP
jgi:hypothetical protein